MSDRKLEDAALLLDDAANCLRNVETHLTLVRRSLSDLKSFFPKGSQEAADFQTVCFAIFEKERWIHEERERFILKMGELLDQADEPDSGPDLH